LYLWATREVYLGDYSLFSSQEVLVAVDAVMLTWTFLPSEWLGYKSQVSALATTRPSFVFVKSPIVVHNVSSVVVVPIKKKKKKPL
ncbi:MAG: hypothetical protein AAGJ80_11140, partial [Cyanobacteria bacterium J06553_1]